jgi:Trk K+ transport system NAD-binding subunit
MGKAIKEKLDANSIDYVIIDENIVPSKEMIENDTFIYSNADDGKVLLEAGIEDASVLIVGTQNDIDNISIIITAQKLNPNLYIIARENTMKEVSVFEAANIDWLFMIEKILINKTSLQLASPLKHVFLKLVIHKDEEWGTSVVNLLKSQIGANPKLMNLTITEDRAYALYNEIKIGEKININILLKSLEDWKSYHNAIPLLLKRGDREILLPHDEIMELGDQMLFACDEESRDEIEYIASNVYDLHYIRTGEEKKNPILEKIFG